MLIRTAVLNDDTLSTSNHGHASELTPIVRIPSQTADAEDEPESTLRKQV